MPILVLRDIDRTLLSVGGADRLVYRDVFRDLVGRPAGRLPATGTGRTVPPAVRELFAVNGVPQGQVEEPAEIALKEFPHRHTTHTTSMEVDDDGRLRLGRPPALLDLDGHLRLGLDRPHRPGSRTCARACCGAECAGGREANSVTRPVRKWSTDRGSVSDFWDPR
ncbi:hypothetical protein ACFO4E_22200 [Nocardiopsis mangrovi]|uniref:Uncharacterized protein n=1 Tax=Nocardiopsis mangrovi TaxID=1179818 RepID=A0ABV9E3I5_9ACTN